MAGQSGALGAIASSASARINPIINSFASVIAPRSRIIDIGAGKGLLALEMTRRLDARVTMVDVARYNQTDLPLAVCDSRTLAFANNSFDYAVLSFVLHHSPNPARIMAEALRVAPQAVVIENDVRGKFRGWVTQVVDSWPALRYGTPPCHIVQGRTKWLEFFHRFPVATRVLGEFSVESDFFRCFTVLLSKKADK